LRGGRGAEGLWKDERRGSKGAEEITTFSSTVVALFPLSIDQNSEDEMTHTIRFDEH
jgi:hypothetical protein